jgi:cobalt-zinc-cadmium efflux system outer membrane protein
MRFLPASQPLPPVVAPLPEPSEPVQGQPHRMALAEFEGLAAANNPSIARAAARVEAARGQWLQTGLPPNPVVGYMGDEIGDEGKAGQQGGFIGQQIVTGGKLRLNRAVACQEIAIAEQHLAVERFRALNDVRIEFYSALIAQHRVSITRELVEIGQRSQDVSNQLLQAKEVSRVDLLQARVETSSARLVAENAQHEYLAAWRRLAAVAGVPGLQPAALEGDLQAAVSEISFDEAVGRLLAGSPELSAAQANVGRAEQVLRRARVEHYPNLDVQVAFQHDNATTDNITSVQVGIPIPAFDRNQGGIRRADAALAAAISDSRRVELDLRRRLASVYERYSNARQQVDTYTHEILPDAQASLDLVTTGYRQSELNYQTVLTSQRTYFHTKLAYLESLQQLRESTVMIEGLLLRDSLQSAGGGQ